MTIIRSRSSTAIALSLTSANGLQLVEWDRLAGSCSLEAKLSAFVSTGDIVEHGDEAARVSVSAFVLAAASREADRVLGRSDQTLIPAGQFDALVAALDQGDPAPRLERAARSPRVYRRA